MKIKTSVTVSEDLLEAVDARIGQAASRSEFIEGAVRSYLAGLVRREQDARDLEIMNRYADEMNAEASDLLDYQAGS
ncbi:MAG: ribbon-helix-helix protein, CopG family [Blastocatellia bacterium]|nr:ribbon-helix-helix protein, CopG family [Blastocatellia bacterium]